MSVSHNKRCLVFIVPHDAHHLVDIDSLSVHVEMSGACNRGQQAGFFFRILSALTPIVAFRYIVSMIAKIILALEVKIVSRFDAVEFLDECHASLHFLACFVILALLRFLGISFGVVERLILIYVHPVIVFVTTARSIFILLTSNPVALR